MDPNIQPIQISSGSSLVTTIVLLYLAAHTAVIVFSFVLQYFDAANRDAVTETAASYVKAIAREWWYGLAVTLLYPTGWLPRLSRPNFDASGGPPVLLLHGYMMNRSCMFALYWRLRRLGYNNLFAVNMRPMFGSVPSMAQRLAVDIRELSATCGGQPITVVAHSLSGIVMRWLLSEDEDLPIERVISIASPHRGTRTAVLGFSTNAVQMRIGSQFLGTLPERASVPWDSIYTELDNVVFPSETAAFGDHSATIEEVGHLSILFSGETLRRVAERLPELSPGDHQMQPLGTAEE